MWPGSSGSPEATAHLTTALTPHKTMRHFDGTEVLCPLLHLSLPTAVWPALSLKHCSQFQCLYDTQIFNLPLASLTYMMYPCISFHPSSPFRPVSSPFTSFSSPIPLLPAHSHPSDGPHIQKTRCESCNRTRRCED